VIPSRAAALLAALLALAPPGRPAAQSLPDSLARRVDRVFAAYDRTDSPGCAVGIYRNGAIRYARGYGMANLELGIAISPRTIFDLGSTSKQFTAFAIALLARDGALTLDDPVRRHVPELGPAADRVTLRHLLHHTSGIRDYLTLMSLAGVRFDDVTTADDALRLLARQQATNFPPGTEYLYSNSGYFLLSVVVERAGGRSLRAFAAERIFGPLGMRHTHFHDDHTMVVPDRATGYAPAPGGGGGYVVDMSNFEQTGDGAVYTSVEDLARWDGNFVEPVVGDAALIREQHRVGVLADGRALDYAAGLVIGTHGGLPTVSHGGSWAGYRAELLRFPGDSLTVACLCNRADAGPGRLAREVAEVLLEGRMEARSAAGAGGPAGEVVGNLPPEVLAARAGIWVSPATGEVRRIRLEDGHLVMGIASATRLEALSPTRFRTPGGTQLVFEGSGRRPLLRVERDGRVLDSLEWRPEAVLTARDLAAYAGRYHAPELDADYDLTVEEGALQVAVRGRRAATLTPTHADGFSDGRLHVTFTRERPGAPPTGFALQAGRVRNIRFHRAP